MMQETNPNISVNKLPAFIKATERGKYNILKLRKYPDDSKFLSNMYNSLRSVVAQYIKDDNHDVTIFSKKVDELLKKKGVTDWKKKDLKNSILILKYLETNAPKILKPFFLFNAKGCQIKEVKFTTIEGIKIDLNPDILLYDKITNDIVGAIKFYFSKTKQFTIMDGQIVSGLIMQQMQKALKVKLSNQNVCVTDVFHGKILNAPTSFDYLKIHLKTPCQDINRIWNKISNSN